MNLKLFFDFETTGLPLYSEPSGDPRQPHIVEVSAQLVDVETKACLASINLIVKPEGWFIPDDVAALHGITTEYALQVGVPEVVALQSLLSLWRAANERVAHVESFDARIARIAIKRLLQDDALADEWKAAPAYCTAKGSRDLVQAPNASGRGFKLPKLSEAYRHFTGLELLDAHRAGPDTEACKRVYFGINPATASANAGQVVDAEYVPA